MRFVPIWASSVLPRTKEASQPALSVNSDGPPSHSKERPSGRTAEREDGAERRPFLFRSWPIATVLTAAASWCAVSRAAPTTGPTIVDDDGGAGVDFTDIQAAVDASADGDVIVVRAGVYGGFVVDDRRLTLLADPGAIVAPDVRIQNLAPGRRVVLSGFALTTLDVLTCAATVFVESTTIDEEHFAVGGSRQNLVFVSRSNDMRVRNVVVGNTMTTAGVSAWNVDESRVELASSTLSGSDGEDSAPGTADDGRPGGAGVVVRNAARVHLARSSSFGGTGGDELGFGDRAGFGGSGLLLHGSSEAIVAGDAVHEIAGGDGGVSRFFGVDGGGGFGLYAATGTNPVRVSGVGLIGGQAGSDAPLGKPLFLGAFGQNGILTQPSPRDPTLEILGAAQQGAGPVTFRVHGESGGVVTLNLGRLAIVQPAATAIEQLVFPLRTISLGALPAQGFVDYVFPAHLFPVGFFLLGQAEVDYGGELRRTNSAPTVVLP